MTEWARAQGIHPQTAYRWFHAGTLPVPAVRVNRRTILVSPDAATKAVPAEALGLYARVSSHDQRGDLDRQVARLSEWAAKAGQPVVRGEAEVGSGMNGARTKLRRLLSDPAVTTVLTDALGDHVDVTESEDGDGPRPNDRSSPSCGTRRRRDQARHWGAGPWSLSLVLAFATPG